MMCGGYEAKLGHLSSPFWAQSVPIYRSQTHNLQIKLAELENIADINSTNLAN